MTKISELSAGTTPDGTEKIPAVQNGVTVELTTQQIANIPAVGTNTNDNAAIGRIGEIIESTVLFGAAVSLSNAVEGNITTILLTAGDWDVWGSIFFLPAGSTTSTRHECWISTVSATFPTAPNGGGYCKSSVAHSAGSAPAMFAGIRRLSLSVPTTVYLTGFSAFAVSTMAAYGYIGARRIR